LKLGVAVAVEGAAAAAAAASSSASSSVIEIGAAFCLAARRKPFPLVPAEEPVEDDRATVLSMRRLERAGSKRAVDDGGVCVDFLGPGRRRRLSWSSPLMLAERPLLARCCASSAAGIVRERTSARERARLLLLIKRTRQRAREPEEEAETKEKKQEKSIGLVFLRFLNLNCFFLH
jgi:hypothetical protein